MSVADEVFRIAKNRLAIESAAVRAVGDALGEPFLSAVTMLFECQGKVFVGGSGTSGTVARRFAHLLSVSGTPAVYQSPMDSLHGASGAISAGDLLFLISNGGSSDEVIGAARIAKSRGAKVIAMTGVSGSRLATEADLSVIVRVPSEADLGGTIATGSSLTQAAWGDAIVEVLMRGRGYSWQDFMTTHPAGAVGERESLPETLQPLDLAALSSGAKQ